MIELIKWTDRNFEFDFPVSLFPSIVARLSGIPAHLEEIAKSLSHEELTKKLNGKWSVQENIGHLLDLEELHSIRLQEYINKADELTSADMTNKKTYESGHNSKEISEILKNFRKARTDYVSILDGLDEMIISHYAYHPRLKMPLRLIDKCFFVAEHDSHHIATIRSIIKTEDLTKS